MQLDTLSILYVKSRIGNMELSPPTHGETWSCSPADEGKTQVNSTYYIWSFPNHQGRPLPMGISETVPTIRAYEVTLWEEESPPFFANKKIQVYSHPVIHCHSGCWWLYIFVDSTTCWNSRRFWLTPLLATHFESPCYVSNTFGTFGCTDSSIEGDHIATRFGLPRGDLPGIHLEFWRLHPGRLTWNIIMEVWKIIFLSKWLISRFHVNLPGCTGRQLLTLS